MCLKTSDSDSRSVVNVYLLPLSCKCAAGLYVPGVVFDGAQGEVFGDLRCRHTVLHILLVGEYQHSCFSQVLMGGRGREQ